MCPPSRPNNGGTGSKEIPVRTPTPGLSHRDVISRLAKYASGNHFNHYGVGSEIEGTAQAEGEVHPYARRSRNRLRVHSRGALSHRIQCTEKADEHGLFKKELDEKLLSGSQKVDINVDRQFEIDWQGEIKREIYQKRLPEFPPEVQQEATIKIQFSILPNGLVGSAVILQKGDTRLENLTLEAFKTWRFNPLPDYVDPAPQSGIISFHFKLK